MNYKNNIRLKHADMHTKFLPRNLKGRVQLEGLGVDREIILKWTINKIECGSVEWIYQGEISGSHGDEYKDGCLLGCSAV
jgi:hypothetical protein